MHFYRPQRSWGKVMFLQVSVILFTGGLSASVHAGIHPPPEQTPPRADTPLEQTPPEQTSPPGADIPPWSRHPREQTPQEQTPLGTDTPWEQTPPQEQTTPPGADTPREQTPPQQSMLGDTVNARAVRILLECNLVKRLFGKLGPKSPI